LNFALGSLAAQLPRLSGILAPALIVLGLTAAVTTTSLQRYWMIRHPIPSSSRPDLPRDLSAIEGALRQRLTRDGTTAVVHRDGAKTLADAIVLELEKDKVDVRVANADAQVYTGVRTANAVNKPLHVYLSTMSAPLRPTACLELIAKSGDAALYGGPR